MDSCSLYQEEDQAKREIAQSENHFRIDAVNKVYYNMDTQPN